MIRFVAKKRRHTVNPSIRSFTYSRLTGAVAALSLCGSAAAWAGDGGSDQASVNTAWQTFCTGTLSSFGVTSCPVVPTVTQGILQLAASLLVPPVVVRANGPTGVSLAPLGQAVDAIDPSLPPALIPVPNTSPQEFVTAITKFPIPAKSTTNTTPVVLGLSDLLPAMTPLAFISSSKSPAPVTQLSNSSANVFLYGVASSQSGSEPNTVFFVYDDPSRTNGNLQQGSVVAEFSFPLVLLTGYSPPPAPSGMETVVPTTLKFIATSAGDCSASTVSGASLPGSSVTVGFSGLMASQIGIDCQVVFAPSPLSTTSHAIFEVAVPLIITQATDILYFGSTYSVTGGPWSTDVTGFPQTPPGGFSGVKGIPDGSYIGLAPSAQPLLPPGTISLPAVIPYALCANLPSGNGNGQAPVPGVAAFYAIGTDGATLLSAPTPGSSTSTCPF
jgi:hypothetical protein